LEENRHKIADEYGGYDGKQVREPFADEGTGADSQRIHDEKQDRPQTAFFPPSMEHVDDEQREEEDDACEVLSGCLQGQRCGLGHMMEEPILFEYPF
jgi:hypothetical protein